MGFLPANFFEQAAGVFPRIQAWLRMPALSACIAFGAGIALSATLPVHLPKSLYILCYVLATLSMISGLLIQKLYIRCACFAVAGLLIMPATLYSQAEIFAALERLDTRGGAYVSGRIVSVPMKRENGYRFLARCDSIYDREGRAALHGKTVLFLSADSLNFGSRILASGLFFAPAPSPVPGAPDRYLYQLSSGIWGTFIVKKQLPIEYRPTFFERSATEFRATVYRTLAVIPDEGRRALLQAAFLGDKNPIPQELQTIFQKAGITHLLAISGQNVAMLTAAILLILFPLPLRRQWKTIITIVVLWWFLFVVGFIPSLFRAVVMATLIAISFLFQRKSYPLNALGLAAIGWLVMSPQSLFTAGFQLSFSATFAIIAFFPQVRKTITVKKSWLRPVAIFLLDGFWISLVCFIATAPVIAWHFGTISLYGLFFNAVAVTLMTISMWALTAAIALQWISAYLAALCANTASFFLGILIASAGFGSRFSWSTLQLPLPTAGQLVLYCLLFLGIFATRRRFLLRFLAVLGAAAAIIIPSETLATRIFDKKELVNFDDRTAPVIGLYLPGRGAVLAGTFDSAQVNNQAIAGWLRYRRAHRVVTIAMADSLSHNPDTLTARCGDTIVPFPGCSCVVVAPGTPEFRMVCTP